MRDIFFKVLADLPDKRKNCYVLTGDLGYKLFDGFKGRRQDRVINMGVAEANMIGVASGLALSGRRVYCYSIVPFLTLRAYEQIKMDVDCHRLNVKLVGAGGGFSYALEGMSHFGLEDLALMTCLQNMTVVVPADRQEAALLAKYSASYDGPMYIRLGRAGDAQVHERKPAFRLGKALLLNEGKKVALFAVGGMVAAAMQSLPILRSKGINPTIVNMHTLKPLDEKALWQIAARHPFIYSLEEHYCHGGLGSLIADELLRHRYKGFFAKIGIPDRLKGYIGDTGYLRKMYRLDPASIARRIMKETAKNDA